MFLLEIDLSVLWKGLFIGLLMSAPVGPVGLLCINRTVMGSLKKGFATGMGAATADTFYAIIAASGLTYVHEFVARNIYWFRLIGGGFLCLFGILFLMALPHEKNRGRTETSMGRSYTSALLITLTNPVTVLAFMALFTTLGLEDLHDLFLDHPYENRIASALLIVGVFLGASCWWLTLSYLSDRFRSWFQHPNMIILNRALGVIFLVCGLATLLLIHFKNPVH